ncbi:class I SAM-dependent methyltransferase [Thiobacillus sedimenti]|uniref:Class I SAM-dependent methyltransferase n=1 Tax=Thiobacillus sedimenti TaxID=3110231 RepID=A0ABZ1CMG2_9PROT|nr:class I SAM-dependent methyltransferase [Thiobacillus sp. SCUT-2]WRS40589.1 class I SAM-dependent methyltransferase [Thiobacillus sp. SCUT-2]
MNPADYDAWYATPRGRWIGNTEYALAMRGLAARPGSTLLDVGCGTGWFTRRAAADGLLATGLDRDPRALDFAHSHGGAACGWAEGDATALPFGDASFDHVMSIAALCFVEDEPRAVAEIVRVARRSFAIGWLNRASLLYRQKGRAGGSGTYRGARWHTAGELRAFFAGLPVRALRVRSAVFLPSGTALARRLEAAIPDALPWGGMLIVSGLKT